MTNAEVSAFLAVVQCGSLTAAAETLYITQPTLSNRIRSLEEETGTPLFRRSKGIRRVELTEAGQRFIPLALRWESLLNETHALSEADQREALRIGAVYSINQYILPPVYQRFLARKLPLSLWVNTIHPTEGFQGVETGEMDLALIDGNPVFSDRVEVQPVFREKILLICSLDSDFPDMVDPATLDTSSEIMMSWNREYSQWHDYWFGVNSRPLFYSDTLQMAEVFPHRQNGWSAAPISAAATFLKSRRARVCHFTQPPPDRVSYLLTRKDTPLSPAMTVFLEDLKTELQQAQDLQYYL